MDTTRDVYRKELKYRLSMSSAAKAKICLTGLLPEDTHNGRDGYTVRSLYFDTLWNRDFLDKEDGLEDRKKVRLRIYSARDSTASVELKEKQGAWQRKRSVPIPRETALEMAAGDYSSLSQMQAPLAQQLYRLMVEESYRPKCIVQYRRYAFVIPTNDIRITFDSDLVSTEGFLDLFGSDAFLSPVGYPDDVTLEVKYNRFLFSYIKDLLEGIDKVPVTYSKYVISRLAYLNPV